MRLSGVVASLGLSVGVIALPAQAQITDTHVGALVEALRQAAPQTGRVDDGLYSEWQIKPSNIPRWSQQCIGRELTPAQFESSPVTARQVLTCIMRDVLQAQYRASGNNETVAVRRAASWWMTGDPALFESGTTAAYTQRVLGFYQNLRAASRNTSEQNTAAYDRHMQAGYTATQQRNYPQALQHFQQALAVRPNDTFAQQAIANVQSYINRDNRATSQSAPPAQQPATSQAIAQPSTNTTSESITQQQAIALINRWLGAKSAIFAPPFNARLANQLTAGELYQSLSQAEGVIAWLRENNAYYRYGVQKVEGVERFVASGDRATLEVRVTEARTLYLNGVIEPTHTSFDTEVIRYNLESVDGEWKITDYKTVDGSLLERSVVRISTNRS